MIKDMKGAESKDLPPLGKAGGYSEALGIMGNVLECFESLLETSIARQQAVENEVGEQVAAIAANRRKLGTLDEEPVDELDVITAGLLTLIKRFERGEELTVRQRAALARILRQGVVQTLDSMTMERARRAAARRGGMAGRTVDPAKVMLTWQAKLAEGGKKTWADAETAKTHSISTSAVRKIRAAQMARF